MLLQYVAVQYVHTNLKLNFVWCILTHQYSGNESD